MLTSMQYYSLMVTSHHQSIILEYMQNHSNVKTYIHTKVSTQIGHQILLSKKLNQDEKKRRVEEYMTYMTVYTSTVGYSKSPLI